eukprot:GHVU01177284.1.p1 GENE.GHVU01177284.1~~GHVU01177284.1.p1  ORF type:complete len:849 (+),score=117.59 GHVU01177284.1:190-2736(+)
MAHGETVNLRMTGGGPWGFRLFGGDGDPLTIAKLRKRSKAHEAGGCEGDILLGINGYSCKNITHGVAIALADHSPTLTMIVFRGSSDRNAINSAFQQLGSQLKPVPASAIAQEASQKAAYTDPSSTPAAPAVSQNVPQRTVNGYAAPGSFSQRQEQHFQEGDTQRHVTTETSKQTFGGTTLTKVTRREESSSYGAPSAFQPAPQKPAAMFNVSSVAAPSTNKPGVWAPSGGGAPLQSQRPLNISAPSGVSVSQNPDQSISMTIGLGGFDAGNTGKENIAPVQQQSKPVPQFNVKKVTKTQVEQAWQPSFGGPKQVIKHQTTTIVAKHTPFTDPEPVPEPLLPRQIPAAIDMSKLIYDGSGSDECGTPDKKKKMFADSAFYDDAEHRYPTIEEQVKMARKVAFSLESPANQAARGHNMFMKRKMKADRWTTVEPGVFLDQNQVDIPKEVFGGEEEKFYRDEPWNNPTHTWQPQMQPSGVRGGGWDSNRIPSPPPLPLLFAPKLPSVKDKEKTNALSAEEFEKLRLYEQKSTHTNVNPAMCFNLAQDLKTNKGKGGKLFAKRKARAEKYVHESESSDGIATPNQNFMDKILLSVPVEQQQQQKVNTAPANKTENMDYLDGGGPVVNRLKDMIAPPKPKMTPWDAAVQSGGVSVDRAFDHLKGYNPYAKQGTDLASQLGSAAVRKEEATAPLSIDSSSSKYPSYNTKVKGWTPSGGADSPAFAPSPSMSSTSSQSYTANHAPKMRPWQGAGAAPNSQDTPASGAAFNAVTPPGSQPAGGFKPMSFKAPGGRDSGVFQPNLQKWKPASGSESGASPAPPTASPMMQPSPVPSYHSTGSASREVTEADGYCDL